MLIRWDVSLVGALNRRKSLAEAHLKRLEVWKILASQTLIKPKVRVKCLWLLLIGLINKTNGTPEGRSFTKVKVCEAEVK
ncbi:MAG: hypothetical protein ACTS6G_02790 [Candidatus Hodgkinia cicadicola]